jgi:phytanoyl-CoA hydroxylase
MYTAAATLVTDEQRTSWERDGFFRLSGFADQATCDSMLDELINICRRQAAGEDVGQAWVMPEPQDLGERENPEELVAKVFRLHRDGIFHDFATRTDVVDLVAELISPDIDCFLSQFIFKNPGAWGQPWHQDSFYFPFEPARPIVGVWLAVTQATLENGCLHVLPGSHVEHVHEHIRDRRPGAMQGYMEIVDHDMHESVPVLMEPGDLLVFDSHLMHRSTDNVANVLRAAMVYHYATAGTVQRHPHPINDFMPARRS